MVDGRVAKGFRFGRRTDTLSRSVEQPECMSPDLESVFATIRERVTPDSTERAALGAVATTVIERAEDAVADLPVEARIEQVGSTARNTWLPGERDIDIFVCFPPNLSRDELETYGLDVGHAVIPDGKEEYAEHPYVTGRVEGFDVDLVPCYDVHEATDIRSAVDRTPFHTRYVDDRLDDRTATEVRVIKQFLTGIGRYGSDLRTRGFSGYLTELLVLEYGDAPSLIEAVADWSPPIRLDPADHGSSRFEDPLVVIDPTDPNRNVAAVLTPETLASTQHYARDLLEDPRVTIFEPRSLEPLSTAEVRSAVTNRGTHPIALKFPTPELVADELWPQLEKSRRGIAAELDRRGFDVLRSTAFAGGSTVLLFELEVDERPTIERHEGPPVAVREHATSFYATYADDAVAGPYVDGDRYVVERERDYRSATAVLESETLFDVGHGPAIASQLQSGFTLLDGEEIATLATDFGTELAAYFDPKP